MVGYAQSGLSQKVLDDFLLDVFTALKGTHFYILIFVCEVYIFCVSIQFFFCFLL